MKKILIIGGCGYIGSGLFQFLINKGYKVDTIDLQWFGNVSNNLNLKKDVSDLNIDFLTQYESIILLSGHSSVKMCEADMKSSFENNVANFVSLLLKITHEQKFIYASSSSVYNNTSNDLCIEEEQLSSDPTNWYDLTKREIDWYAQLSGKECYGLRFGTVNGYASHMRVDLMINAMYHNAKEKGFVSLFNGKVRRPILGIQDLCKAVEIIITSKEDKRGIYNLASFNSTAETIADNVATHMHVEVDESPNQIPIINTKLQTHAYDFLISSEKFEKSFSFVFEDTLKSILESLDKGYETSLKTERSKPLHYAK